MPASTALLADYVPREMRGRVMAAIGRGSVLIGATGGGTGGPGMGYLFTIPVIMSSLVGGFLYSMNPRFPWLVIAITSACPCCYQQTVVRGQPLLSRSRSTAIRCYNSLRQTTNHKQLTI